MPRVLRALPDLLRVGFAEVVAYRAELVIWIFSATLPLIMLALWNAVAAGGSVAGFDQIGFTRYFAATLLIRQLTAAWVVWELSWEIRTGRFSPRLLRPMHPLIQHAVPMVAALPFRVVVLLPVLVALVVWRPDLVAVPSPWALVLLAVTLPLAWLLNFLVQSLFAIGAFWIDKSEGLFGVWFAAWSLLSGYIAPLAVFPEALQPLIRVLPFRGMLAVPVELLGGFLTPSEALFDVAVQLGWVLVFVLVVRWTWHRGLARYGAFGG